MSSTLLRFAVFAVGGRAGVATDVTCREPLRAEGTLSATRRRARCRRHQRPEQGFFSARDKYVAADLLELASRPLNTRASSTVPRIAPIMTAPDAGAKMREVNADPSAAYKCPAGALAGRQMIESCMT